MDQLTLNAFQLVVDVEDGFPRKMSLAMAVQPNPQNPDIQIPIDIPMKVVALETGIDVPAALFGFEVPQDAITVVEGEFDPETIQQLFAEAIMRVPPPAGGELVSIAGAG